MRDVSICEVQAPLHDDNAATAQTVAMMGAHVRDSWQDPEVRRCALDAVTSSGSRPQSAADIAACVWAWCKRNIQFVTDQKHMRALGLPVERELLISPKVMARMSQRKGDCDCITMFADSMCAALGVTPLIKTFKCDADDHNLWSHVCAAALLENGDVIPVDASHGEYFGWEVPAGDVYDSQLWDMQGRKVGPSKMQSKGLSGYVPYQGWSGLPAGIAPADNWRGVNALAERRRGLAGIRRAKYGFGDCGPSGYDEYDQACVYIAPGADLSAANAYINTPGATLTPAVVNQTSAASNLTTLFSQLLGTGAQLGSQALNANRPVVVAPAPTSLFGSSSTSTLMILGLVGLAVVVIASKK